MEEKSFFIFSFKVSDKSFNFDWSFNAFNNSELFAFIENEFLIFFFSSDLFEISYLYIISSLFIDFN